MQTHDRLIVGAVFVLASVLLPGADYVPVYPYRLDAVLMETTEAGWKLLDSDADANLAQVLADPATDATEFRGLPMDVDEMKSVDVHQNLHWPESLKGKDVSFRRPAGNRMGATLDVRIIEAGNPDVRMEAHLTTQTLRAWEETPPFGHYPIVAARTASAEMAGALGIWAIVRWPKQDQRGELEDHWQVSVTEHGARIACLLLRVRKPGR